METKRISGVEEDQSILSAEGVDYDGEAKLLEDLVLGDEGKDECFQSYQGSRSKEKTIQYSLAQHHDYPLDNSEMCIQGLKEREKKSH